MKQSINQNANEHFFFSNKKTSCIFRTHWCVTSGLSLTEKKYADICHQFQSETILLIVKRLGLVGHIDFSTAP